MTFKGRLIVFLGIFCIAALMASSQVAQGKPEKPDKPGQTHTEWIQFIGDLQGGQPVDGCCPNAGPNPPYHMCLDFEGAGPPFNTCHEGYLFINFFGAGRDQQYLVKFFFSHGDIDYGIRIVGGDIDYDRRTKTLTVTFTDELCVDNYTGQTIAEVSFTLERRPY